MSVLIRGAEMPQNCCDCFMDKFKCLIGKSEMPVERMARERHPNCPLVSVPPHGRLIDADALAETHRKMAYENGGRSYPFHILAKSWVEDAPTIIEAEEEYECYR